jgi:two-component system, chemotaxis family, response regulator PixG
MNIANSVLLQQLQFCNSHKFTGKLSIDNFHGENITSMKGDCWGLLFSRGKLVGNIAGIHPLRSIQRQFDKQKIELSPGLAMELSNAIQTPDLVYWLIEELPSKSSISREKILRIIEGSLSEVLFDILRCEILTTKTAAAPLSYMMESHKFKNNFIPIIPGRFEVLWQDVTDGIKNWRRQGLMQWSPHLAPQVTDFLNLKKVLLNEQSRCIAGLANGERTIWDIAQAVSEDVSLVGAEILKCYREEAMTVKPVRDFNWREQQEANFIVKEFLNCIEA